MAHSHKPTNGLSLAFFLNLLFAVIEFIGGYYTKSNAIIADAFHDLMDSGAIGVAVLMEKFSKKPSSNSFSFGYKRFSLLSAIVMSSILLVGALLMLNHTYNTYNQTKEVNSLGMLALAVLGILINGFAFLKIRNGGENHEHEHEHDHNHKNEKHDANSKAILLHLLEDVLGWIAVLIGAIVMYFTNWFWIDSLLTVLIALFISYNAIVNLWGTFKILLQAVPNGINLDEIKNQILNIEDVTQVNKLQIWSMDGVFHNANVHIEINNIMQLNEVQNKINLLLKKFNITETSIQINM